MIDIAEVNAPFAFYELALCEALGFCSKGDFKVLIEAEDRLGDGPAVNLSGGTLCTNAPNSGGLFRVAQAIQRLHEIAPGKTARALVHDSDASLGMGGDSHAILILEREAQ